MIFVRVRLSEYLYYFLLISVLSCNFTPTELQLKTQTSKKTCVVSKIDINAEKEIVDCTGQNLGYIPSFQYISKDVVKFFLDGNQIHNISDFRFSKGYNIKVLTVTKNRLEYISPRAFDGLNALEILDLSHNFLKLNNGMWRYELFRGLTNLKVLDLSNNGNDNIEDGEFQNNIFNGVERLESLVLDTFYGSVSFRYIFSNMSALDSLDIRGGVRKISNATFIHLKHVELKTVKITNCDYLKTTELNAFKHLHHLHSLYFLSIFQGVGTTLRSLYPFRNQPMKTIYFSGIDKSTFEPASVIASDSVLDRFKFEFMSSICIEHFTLKSSKITPVNVAAINWPVWNKCMKSIDFSGNRINGDRMSLFRILKLKHLQYLNLAQNKIQNPEYSSNIYNKISTFDASEVSSWHYSNCVNSTEIFGVKATISKSLQHINMESTFKMVGTLESNYTFLGAENLRELYLQNNGIYKMTGNVKGLCNLEVLDMSWNDCSEIHSNFFVFFQSLKLLNLRKAKLDSQFMSIHSRVLFRPLTRLKLLDLSGNNLRSLCDDTFKYNALIESVYLANNHFISIPFDISFLPNLKYIDLSFNAITKLGETSLSVLDRHSKTVTEFILNLSGNDITCGCSSIYFMKWLFSSNVNVLKKIEFDCKAETGQLVTISNYDDIKVLWRQCTGFTFLLLSLTIFLVMTLGFLIVWFYIKNKTRIYNFIYRIQGFPLKQPCDYANHVYLEYSDSDYKFACFVLYTFIEQDMKMSSFVRDIHLIPGADMSDAITTGLWSSWRVIFVITKAYLEDEQWANFVTRTASYTVTPANPGFIVLIVEENVKHRIPDCLLQVVEEENIVLVPRTDGLSDDTKERLYHLLWPEYL